MDSPSTRASLLASLRSGDTSEAWARFHDRYLEFISAIARRWGLQPADRDDVIQDAFSRLLRVMPEFEYDPGRGRFRGYLKAVVRSAVASKLRQIARTGAVQHTGAVPDSSDEAFEFIWETEWRRHHVRTALRHVRAEFSSRDQEAFQRCVVRGEAPGIVADDLSMSVDHVYQVKSRIMKRLSQRIAEQIEEEDA